MPTSHTSQNLRLNLKDKLFEMRFAKLRKGEAHRIAKKLQAKKWIIEQFSTWEEARKHKGLNPHKVRDTKTPDGDDLWSIKLDDKARMLVYVRGQEVVAWSVHPDHDSAYKSRR